jgi:phytoene/squalene synthetase
MVKKYDPSGYLPGLLLSTNDAKIGYYAVRSFWIESGLRFQEEPLLNSLSASKQIAGVGQKGTLIPDHERIQTWKDYTNALYDEESAVSWEKNATLRLLRHVVEKHSLSRKHFDQIILGREKDVDMKQYPTVKSLEDHGEMSCGSLFKLVLECGGIHQSDSNSIIFDAAREVGITHGLANALRTSVPTASATGKVIVPLELCEKYGVRSPRYLLNALGMGDEECKRHLQSAVEDIVTVARHHLVKAREKKDELASHPMGAIAASVFLPALASETFLNRLEKHGFDLQDRTLRSVGKIEHMQCAGKLVAASLQKTF